MVLEPKNITPTDNGQLSPALSIPALADFIEAIYSELKMLGPWPALCARELLCSIEAWEQEGKPWE